MSDEIKPLLGTFGEWIAFVHFLREQSEDVWHSSIEAGKWTIKDIVCHMQLWDKYFYDEAINQIAIGKPVTLKHLHFDEFNARAISYAKTISVQELVDRTVSCRERIIAAIASMSEETAHQNYIDGDGNHFNVVQYVKDFIWHDQHHMDPMQKYLKVIQ